MSRLVSTPYSYYILLSLLAPALVSRSLFFISSYPIPPQNSKKQTPALQNPRFQMMPHQPGLAVHNSTNPPHTQNTLYLRPNPLPFPPPAPPNPPYLLLNTNPPPPFRCLFYDQKMMNIFILLYLLTAPGHTSCL